MKDLSARAVPNKKILWIFNRFRGVITNEKLAQQMDKSIEHMDLLYSSIHDGKINYQLLDGIWVECYNGKTLLRHLALVTTVNQSLLIEPYDSGILVNIEKAIRKSDLNLGIQKARSSLLVRVPKPSSEQKLKLIKYAKQIAEDTKISIRNLRRQARKQAILSDKRVEEITYKYISLIDKKFDDKKRLIANA